MPCRKILCDPYTRQQMGLVVAMYLVANSFRSFPFLFSESFWINAKLTMTGENTEASTSTWLTRELVFSGLSFF